MSTTTTPYMNLILPVPTSEPGPTWAEELVTAYETIDSHNHTSGQGVQIPSAGISINADLNVNNYNFTNFRSTRFQDQGSSLAGANDKGCLYIAGGNLYYNNGSGVAIQLTAGSALNAASIGGIGGDYSTSTASEYYTSAQTTFYFTQAANTVAALAGGAYSFYYNLLSGFAVTMQASASLGASYSLTLPTALPASQAVLTSNASGVMSFATIDNSTLEDSSNVLQIKDHGVTQVKMAAMATGSTVAAGGFATSSSSGSFSTSSTSAVDVTNLSVTITTTGRPVYVGLMAVPSASAVGYLGANNNTLTTATMQLYLLRGATQIKQSFIDIIATGANIEITVPPESYSFFDAVAAGTYTYKVQASVNAASTNGLVNECVLVAYEI